MRQTDFSVPQRMSAGAFVIIFLKTLKGLINVFIIAIIVNFFSPERNRTFMQLLLILGGCMAGCVVIALICAFLEYNFKKFYIKDGCLVFISGVIRRQTITIPLDKIHTLRTKSGMVYRLFDIKGIAFDTLASKIEEVELILNEADWTALKNLIDVESVSGPSDMKNECVDSKQDETLHFQNINLIKGAFCQNHFKAIALLLGVVAAVGNQLYELNENMSNGIVDYLDSNFGNLTGISVLDIVGILVLVYIFAMILWLGKMFLRYYDMTLQTSNDQLLFQSGLFSRYSSRLSYDKICTVYIKRNILEKKLNCSTLILKQAFNATMDNGESDVKIYGSNYSERFLCWWLGDDYKSSPTILSAQSGKGVMFHAMKFDLVISLVAVILLCHFGLWMWLLLPAAYMVISVFKGICAIKRSNITLKESYLVINTGRFADIHNYLKYNNVETVCLKRTPLTPLFHKVSLMLSTNGTTFIVRSLPNQEATQIYELLLSKQSH